VMFSAVWWWMTRDAGRHLVHRPTPEDVRSSRRRFGLGVVVYAPTLALSFISAPLTLAVHGALAVYYAFEQLNAG
jgi:hypothetical protein